MIDLLTFNLFNTLFVSSVRITLVQQERCHIFYRDVLGNYLLLLMLDLLTSFFGIRVVFNNLEGITQNVARMSSVLRYASVTYVHSITILLFLVQRKKVFALVEKLLLFDRMYSRMVNQWQLAINSKRTKAQVALLAIIYVLILTGIVYTVVKIDYGLNTRVMLITCTFTEFHFYLQQVYAQYFAEHIAKRYGLLRSMISNDIGYEALRSVMKLYDKLNTMKRLLSEAFGLYLVLCSLIVFLHCAIIIYSAMVLIEQDNSWIDMLLKSFNLLPVVVLFYGLTYEFNNLILEEEEFKTAVKSLLYNSTEDQSEEYLDFLDLINLNLMTESPKVTACGLFTVNLQVFYNVFAAIVTYIMILFQFRDFEK